ncbi:hypothetical protein [Amycolatopsis sp. NPDC051371]|uniref:hypothetical protein n=1 Tax=Amycolatopsis sp. NPDC051371 TaxID=3155800 RepID=UPI00344A1659
MKTFSPRVWGVAALACSGGAQVFAGMVGNLLLQLALLLLTMLGAGVGAWLADSDASKKILRRTDWQIVQQSEI